MPKSENVCVYTPICRWMKFVVWNNCKIKKLMKLKRFWLLRLRRFVAVKKKQNRLRKLRLKCLSRVLPVINADLKAGIGVLDAFLQIGFVGSKGEARRLIKQAGLKINDKLVTDENYVITSADLVDGAVKISQGKKKFGLIK